MTSLRQVEDFWERVCFDPHYRPEGRFQTYRDLVFEGMFEVIQNICPIIRSILSDTELKQLFWDFLLSAPPQSPVLRRLPWEVSQFLRRGNHSLLKKYPWLGELMEYEYLEIQVRFAEEEGARPARGKVSLNPAHALGEFTWPVHFISEKKHDAASMPRGRFFLLLWRDPKTLDVNFMEVNILVATMVRTLRSGSVESQRLLEEVAREVSLPVTTEYLQEGHGLIRDFISKGIAFGFF